MIRCLIVYLFQSSGGGRDRGIHPAVGIVISEVVDPPPKFFMVSTIPALWRMWGPFLTLDLDRPPCLGLEGRGRVEEREGKGRGRETDGDRGKHKKAERYRGRQRRGSYSSKAMSPILWALYIGVYPHLSKRAAAT